MNTIASLDQTPFYKNDPIQDTSAQLSEFTQLSDSSTLLNPNANPNSRFTVPSTSVLPTVSFLISDIVTGSKVMFVPQNEHSEYHTEYPEYFPEPNTVGEVIKANTLGCVIQWPNNSTSKDDIWCVDYEDIILLKEVKKEES